MSSSNRGHAFPYSCPLIRRSKQRISPGFRRYAGISVDNPYDHFLASQWHSWSDVSLEHFAHEVYRTLHSRHETFPAKMQRCMTTMVSNRLGDSISELVHNYASLREDLPVISRISSTSLPA